MVIVYIASFMCILKNMCMHGEGCGSLLATAAGFSIIKTILIMCMCAYKYSDKNTLSLVVAAQLLLVYS